MMELATFADQCCDARHYLVIGEACAMYNDCYNDLRPMGASLWFSLPLRMGLPAESVIWFNLVLIAISVALATIAMYRRLRPSSRLMLPVLAVIISAVHLLWLAPVLRNALSDAPAALFAVIGIWLLLIAPSTTGWKTASYVLAGLCLGGAAWLRAFYLYPVYGLLAVITIQWFRYCDTKYLLLLTTALLPVFTQYYCNWKHTGSFSYVAPFREQQQVEEMMTYPVIGYDTLLPGDSFLWHSNCTAVQPTGTIANINDFQSLACMVAGRIYFYLGSYSTTTYWYPRKQLSPINITELLMDSGHAIHPAVITNANMTPSPNGNKIDIIRTKADADSRLDIPVTLSYQHKYRFAITARGEGDNQLLSIRISPVNAEYAVEKKFLLKLYPETMDLGFFNTDPGLSDYVFSIVYPAATSEIGKIAHQRGIEINRSNTLTIEALSMKDRDPGALRHWSPWIMLVNGIILLWAYRLLYLTEKSASNAGMALLIFPLLCFAEALLLLPEQRYIIAPLLIIWVLCSSWTVSHLFRCLRVNTRSS